MTSATVTARRRRPAQQFPASASETPSRRTGRHSNAALAGPPVPILISILISFTSTTILVSSLIRLGPQVLEPIYGNILPFIGYMHVTIMCLGVGAIMGCVYWRRILSVASPEFRKDDDQLTADTRTARALSMAFDMAAIVTALAPLRATYVFRWSGRLGPTWGPFVSHCTLVLPVFILGGFVTGVSAARVAHNPQSPTRHSVIFIAYLAAVCLTTWIGHQFSTHHRGCYGLLLNAGYAALSSLMIKLLAGHQENVDAAEALAKAQSQEQQNRQRTAHLRERQLRKLRFLPTAAFVFFALTTLFGDPRCATGLTAKNNADTSEYVMLSRAESVTGWVSVSDESRRKLRLLRSGHSIIGGHWNETGESIFGIFYYADAVRLVSDRKSNPEAKRDYTSRKLSSKALVGDGSERALQIGLGIGVSARSLHQQNVRVDIVEIDPEVYRAAIDFFSLPRNLNGVHLMDGRRFIDEAQQHIYDYVIHDVFTGGSVPASLFSQSAIAQIQRILKPDGILAMNYVGVPSDTRSLAHIAFTLRSAFPHLRCFAESLDDRDSMVNMMFFASAKPIRFDITPDVLRAMGSSTIRSRTLQDMEKNEIDVDAAVKSINGVRPITDKWNPLPLWQADPAAKHWHAMRDLFPESFWLNY
ncbi:hypothetical protein IW140_001082 [Coemansia sp. RSA 1813]|nr:hypothetical protein EV178_002309 [Coemansia sp. RSA 1646]KAJ1773115.1 hypothetical protein LPJ74_000854 [Coemansia sp. RSA 1843]KAJ2091992.1 hypothetical protein IW138_001358 [Coemansia sp. RSA 986]KAJ2216671.1 hypothetical protein EV179_001210 [Coemansia sp. RSA 487]KAJ2572042.1 hypothetical protein IW140_001082 [Coemansia sp. RSA 1813]